MKHFFPALSYSPIEQATEYTSAIQNLILKVYILIITLMKKKEAF